MKCSSIIIVFSFLGFVGLGLDSKAMPADSLSDTGQTTCYNANGEILDPCPLSGQNFHGQDGNYQGLIQRFQDNGNGTVTDLNNGLVWQKEDDNHTYNWYQASGTFDAQYNPSSQDVCKSFGAGWELPTKKNLLSIVDYSIPSPGPTINTSFFSNTKHAYWSSTSVAHEPIRAWRVGFVDGSACAGCDGGKGFDGYYVRCVKGGSIPEQLLFDNMNGSISDNITGLIWQQREAGQKDWGSALNYCEGLTLANKSDWRLPNIKELESIADDTRYDPATDTTFFPDSMSGLYWSSTTVTAQPGIGWNVNFSGHGATILFDKQTYTLYVRCVRGGTFEHKIPPGTIPPIAPTPVITEFGELTPTGTEQFNKDQDLFVISHGWNNTDPVNTNLPLWEIAMALDVKNKSGISGGNVLKWNWQEKAKSDRIYNPISGGNLLSDSSLVQMILGVPYDNVRDSGKYLSNAIRTYLQNEGAGNYSGSIHMIGHSLGSGVIIQAALRLTDDHDSYLNYNVRQLTLLDSPWYVFAPSIQQLKLRDFFIDNYYTMLGRPQGYSFADVNVWIDNYYSKLVGLLNFDQLSNGHQLAHQWYRSSITNFQNTSIIGFDDSVPTSTKHYGYYWHDHQDAATPNMFHYFGEPYWKLRKGLIQTTGEYITDAANTLSEITQNTKDNLEEFAITSAINVTIVAAETLNKIEDTVDYITDAAGHALWVYNATTGNGYLKLILNSEALASVPVTIPVKATSMQFNYEFSTGCDSQSQLDVYLNDTLVFTTLAGDVFGTDGQFSGWINVTDHAGQQVDMTYRLSNPVDGPLGEIALDDIIFAKLSSLEMQINTGSSWPMFLPAITGAK